MVKSVAKKIAGWSCKDSEIITEEYEVILYGIEVFLETILKSVLLICIGLCLHQVKEVFIIVCSFCAVRIHAGGVHARSSLGCTVFMIMVEIGSVVLNKYVKMSDFTYLLLAILCNMLIYLYAPNGSKSCELFDDLQKKRKMQFALCTANILFLVAYFLEIQKLIFIPIFIEAVSLLFYEWRKEVGTCIR